MCGQGINCDANIYVLQVHVEQKVQSHRDFNLVLVAVVVCDGCITVAIFHVDCEIDVGVEEALQVYDVLLQNVQTRAVQVLRSRQVSSVFRPASCL